MVKLFGEVSYTSVWLNCDQAVTDNHACHVHHVSEYLWVTHQDSIFEDDRLLAPLLPPNAICYFHDWNLLAFEEDSETWCHS